MALIKSIYGIKFARRSETGSDGVHDDLQGDLARRLVDGKDGWVGRRFGHEGQLASDEELAAVAKVGMGNYCAGKRRSVRAVICD